MKLKFNEIFYRTAFAIALLWLFLGLVFLTIRVGKLEDRIADIGVKNNTLWFVHAKAHGELERRAAALEGEKNEVGLASWYGPGFEGRQTASGTTFRMHEYTAASVTLPLGTWIRIENLENGMFTFVQITDRGPYIPHRILDLAAKPARDLGMVWKGVAVVRIKILEYVPLDIVQSPKSAAESDPTFNPYGK
jgi:rare lipoprotein A (peptidoglycan hydrolase)